MARVAAPRRQAGAARPATRATAVVDGVRERLIAGQPHPMRAWAWAVLVVEAVVLVAMLFVHTRWEDEAQAWLLARDVSPLELITHALRYEGSPGLWHLLLMPFAKLGLPFATLGVISAVAALSAGYLFLRYSPFPAIVRALFPLSYFVLYQYGVVARSYCLLAPLLFLVAILFPKWRQQPLTMALLLCLVANISVHGMLISLGIVAASLPAARRAWPELSLSLRRRHLVAGAIETVVLLALVAMLWPPADLGGPSGWNLSIVHFITTAPFILVHAVAENVVSLLALAVTAVWLWRERALLLFVVPTAGLLVLYNVKYFSPWNEGPLVLLWLAVLWIVLARRVRIGSTRDTLTVAMCATLGVALIVQVSWSVRTVLHEVAHPYSSSAAVVEYIRNHDLVGPQLDVAGYAGVAVLSYFSTDVDLSINGGRPTAYWIWSSAAGYLSSQAIVAHGAEYVLLPVKSASGHFPCLDGYEVVTTFAGGIFYKTHVSEGDGAVLFKRLPGWSGRQPEKPGDCGSVSVG
ncbi:MAG: hypothetical protein JF887_13995 [Candidatus Dormibacteraeota bacterium]|uniref:Uncharacterized protein n=1 Tax=Candidatus Amunia macphersoniae TaxID=3127014 RepID=A0A934NGV6_9BACT|nr:hypothetical protein [Candidatus Dormibacteraeota bacterium]